MVDLTPFLPGLSPVQGKAVVARFDGGRLSSNSPLRAYLGVISEGAVSLTRSPFPQAIPPCGILVLTSSTRLTPRRQAVRERHRPAARPR